MKISLNVCAGSSREEVIKDDNGNLRVYIRQMPVQGKANKALIKVLADYYKIRKSDIRILTGSTSRNKVVEIDR